MRTPFLLLVGHATACVALLHSTTAHALGPVDVEIAARGGFASSPTHPNGDLLVANPDGPGVGGPAGISPFGFYASISGICYLGGTSSSPVGSGGSLSTTTHSTLLRAEVGHAFSVPHVKFRPQVGVGWGGRRRSSPAARTPRSA